MNILQLQGSALCRRDTEENYRQIENTFIPRNGEIVLIDTENAGLRIKIGNGVLNFANLKYLDSNIAEHIVLQGYYHNNNFYIDRTYTVLLAKDINKIYIDKNTYNLYLFNGIKYVLPNIPSLADDNTYGISKLYSTLGDNEDGSITQKAISQAFSQKVEIDVDLGNETLVFFNGGN